MEITKTQIEIDFDVNQSIKNQIEKGRKLKISTLTKERKMGIMVEERYKLEKALTHKKMTFSELIIFLNRG